MAPSVCTAVRARGIPGTLTVCVGVVQVDHMQYKSDDGLVHAQAGMCKCTVPEVVGVQPASQPANARGPAELLESPQQHDMSTSRLQQTTL